MSENSEVTLLKTRARLFEMSQPAGSSGPGTWVEKGQGSLKLMKSPLTERTRMVMVKERPTNDGRMDILLNQVVHWESTLVPAQSDDGSSNRAYVFEAEDYAVSSVKSTKSTYALRFKTTELAEAFKVKYDEAQASNRVALMKQSSLVKVEEEGASGSLGSARAAEGPHSPAAAAGAGAAGAASKGSSEGGSGAGGGVGGAGGAEGSSKASSGSSTLLALGASVVVVAGVGAAVWFSSNAAGKEKIKTLVVDVQKRVVADTKALLVKVGLSKK